MRLSPSAISMYRRCSLQWWFRYRANIRMKPTTALGKGVAVHKGAEVGYRYTVATNGDPAPLDVVTDATAQEFDAFGRDGYVVEEPKPRDDGKAPEKPQTPGEAKDRAVGLVRLHQRVVAPTVQPAILERFVTWKVPKGPDLIGKVDVVETDGTLRDLKTKGRKESADEIRTNTQLALYVGGFEQAGIPLTRIALDRLIDTKEQKVQPIEPVLRAQVEVARAEHVARRVQAGIDAGLFLPADDPRVCGWCGYRDICWGAKVWEYIGNPDLAQRAAQRVMEGNLLPKDTRSVPLVNDPSEEVPA